MSWMDIVIVCIFGWCVAVGMRQGVFFETFRVLGVFFTTVFALHFFPMCAQFLRRGFPIAPRYVEFVSYIFLWMFIVLSFKLICDAMGLFRRVPEGEELFFRSRMWGAGLGFLRAILVSGLTFTAVVILDYTPTVQASQASLSGKILFQTSLNIYGSTPFLVGK